MKKIIFAIIVLFAVNSQVAFAQSWVAVGNPRFSDSGALYSSIAINASGTPYVVYEDVANNKKATVKKYNGINWETVGSPGFSAGRASYTSMAIDGSGTPYVVYADVPIDSDYGPVTVMKYDGASWVTVGSAGFSANIVTCTSIAIGANDTPYVVYTNNGDTLAGYATLMKYNGSSWIPVGGPTFSTYGAVGPALAIDGSGTPYVVYSNFFDSSKATVMKYYAGNWVAVGSPDFSPISAGDLSIAINASGTPYVFYADFSDSGKATVVQFNGSSWVTVGSAHFSAPVNWLAVGPLVVSQMRSLVIDGSGTPYVAYADNNDTLRATVMKYNGSSWVTAGPADFSVSTAYGISIALDENGVPYVVYADGSDTGAKATVMKFEGASGIHEVGRTTTDIQIYPNPLSSIVQIKAPAKVNVTILNMLGQVVLEQRNATDINMSGMANGIYIIKAYDVYNVILKTEKLVKAE